MRKEKVIQFGEGGFLRGFADWMLQIINEKTDFGGSVVVVQPIEKGMCDALSAQNCEYTHICRGAEGVETKKIDVISRCIKPYENFDEYLKLAENPDFRFVISNTTEAGIAFDKNDACDMRPPRSFPAKLTLLLKKRFDLGLKGFIFLPCELIDKNGARLKETVLQYASLWSLGEGFIKWVEAENIFCNTLVDRINTGYPSGEENPLMKNDKMLNTSEYFHLWVIEGPKSLLCELPFDKAGLNVIVTDNMEMYRTRKVRILNGAHTSMVCKGLLEGFDTVKSCMDDKNMRCFIEGCIFEEIIPSLDYPKAEMEDYAVSVLKRFENPYINHYLSSISLNSVSKFKVRVLPSVLSYKEKFGKLPERLTLALFNLIKFYKTDKANDLPEIIEYMKNAEIKDILANKELWEADLSFMYDEVMKYENK